MLTIFFNIRKEFSVENNGHSFCSRRAIARMTGKHRKTIQYLLDCISGGKLPHKMFESFSGITFHGGEFIPDTLASWREAPHCIFRLKSLTKSVWDESPSKFMI